MNERIQRLRKELTEQMERFLIRQLLEYVPEEKIFRWES